jgi:hypothetical protein
MQQNVVTLNLSESQLVAVDAALTELEIQLTGLVALSPATKKRMQPMGEKSEAFCRQALRVLNENPQVVPPSLDVTDAVNDLKTLDQLRPRAIRLSRLMSRLEDTDFALGSVVMQTATQGYALLKLVGRAQGLDEVRKGLGTRFIKRRRQPEEEVKAA